MNIKTWAVVGIFAASSAVFGADAAKKKAAKAAPAPELPVFTTVESAGVDYKLQGEYAADKLGIQVIALGKGQFRAVFLAGGLPGAGWDGKAKVEVESKADGEKIEFPATQGHSATLAAGIIKGTVPGGRNFEARRIVRESPAMGMKPPAGAIVLFDGSNADAFNNGHMDDRKLLASGTTTKQNFQDFSMHLEFLLPFKPEARGQARGNSGVYIQNRYEVQVLDSFGLKGENNECGGLYKTVAPKVNMCLPPLQWQTYDIDFTAPRFDAAGKKTKSAVITVKHNGVLVHENQEIPSKTGGGGAESSAPGPIQFQGHGNPVFYRNVWIVEKK